MVLENKWINALHTLHPRTRNKFPSHRVWDQAENWKLTSLKKAFSAEILVRSGDNQRIIYYGKLLLLRKTYEYLIPFLSR